MAKIQCLICGLWFDFLPRHLKARHGIGADDYKIEFDLPAGMPLASDEYRQNGRDRIERMKLTGQVSWDHLADATEKSRQFRERPKRGAALDKQREVVARAKPYDKNRLPPGAKRADGRDADRAREYQREYRRRKKAEQSEND